MTGKPRTRWLSVSRTVGTAPGSALALALLVCWCVFAALAGPALSLHTRTLALHQTLAGYPDTTKTVQVTACGDVRQDRLLRGHHATRLGFSR